MADTKGSYDTNFLKGILDANNSYTAGFGGEKTYAIDNTPKEGAGLLPNRDATWYDPTSKYYRGNAWANINEDRKAIESGDYSKVSNPDGLSQDLLHFLYKKGAALNLYGMNDFLNKRNAGTQVYDAAMAEQVSKPYIAKRAAGKGVLGGILGAVAPIALSFIPGVGPILGAATGAALNASKGNWLGAITSLAGMPGIGSGISSAVGSTFGSALSNSAAGSLANALGGDTVGNLINIVGKAEGGQVKGQGDGMSDGVPAVINGGKAPTPAALSDGEHVVPALQVALLGRGSSDAGSKRVKEVILKEIQDMYGDEIDPIKAQKQAMKKVQK